MILDIAANPGTFYKTGDGYFLPIVDIKERQELTVGKQLTIVCMFDIYIVLLDNVRVGFYFVSRFSVRNRGGYLITFLARKSQATEYETLIRTDDLVVYHYPNRGTLAVSPLVNSEINSIFTEQ